MCTHYVTSWYINNCSVVNSLASTEMHIVYTDNSNCNTTIGNFVGASAVDDNCSQQFKVHNIYLISTTVLYI